MKPARVTRLRRRLIWTTGLVLVFAGVLFAGPLFAWSPITPGYNVLKSGPVSLHYRASIGLLPAHQGLDTTTKSLETELGLRFKEPVHVVLCDEWTDFRRFTPWLKPSHGLGAITLPIGLMVYVTPLVRDRGDVKAFIAHELAHVLLYQQTSISQRLEMERQHWLVEGVGVRFGNPDSYMSWDEFRAASLSVDLTALLDPDAGGGPRVGGPRLAYSAYRFFIDSLIDRHGAGQFQTFLSAYVADPEHYRQSFAAAFHGDFDDAVRGFAASAR